MNEDRAAATKKAMKVADKIDRALKGLSQGEAIAALTAALLSEISLICRDDISILRSAASLVCDDIFAQADAFASAVEAKESDAQIMTRLLKAKTDIWEGSHIRSVT